MTTTPPVAWSAHDVKLHVSWNVRPPGHPHPHDVTLRTLGDRVITTWVMNDADLKANGITRPFTPLPGVWYSIEERKPELGQRVVAWSPAKRDWYPYKVGHTWHEDYTHWQLISPFAPPE